MTGTAIVGDRVLVDGAFVPAAVLVRDGRIDRKVTVARPCEKSAAEIVRLNMSRVPLRKGLTVEDVLAETISLIFSSECRVKAGLCLRDIVSGAMLANCVNLAVSSAIQRDLSVGKVKSGSGVIMEDIKLAVGLILKQSQTVVHDLGA